MLHGGGDAFAGDGRGIFLSTGKELNQLGTHGLFEHVRTGADELLAVKRAAQSHYMGGNGQLRGM